MRASNLRRLAALESQNAKAKAGLDYDFIRRRHASYMRVLATDGGSLGVDIIRVGCSDGLPPDIAVQLHREGEREIIRAAQESGEALAAEWVTASYVERYGEQPDGPLSKSDGECYAAYAHWFRSKYGRPPQAPRGPVTWQGGIRREVPPSGPSIYDRIPKEAMQ